MAAKEEEPGDYLKTKKEVPGACRTTTPAAQTTHPRGRRASQHASYQRQRRCRHHQTKWCDELRRLKGGQINAETEAVRGGAADVAVDTRRQTCTCSYSGAL